MPGMVIAAFYQLQLFLLLAVITIRFDQPTELSRWVTDHHWRGELSQKRVI
jgi:hypothetical protein